MLQLREASERASVPAGSGGAGGLSRLRWPPGRREVAETVGLLPAGGGVGSSISPRVSRVSFPASKSRRRRRRLGIMSSRVLPRLDGAPLRRRRRARGGGVPGVDPLYRSPWPAARRHVSPLAFCSVDLGQAVGFVDARWPDLAWLPLGDGGRRWRVRIWELEELGCGPGRWATANGFFSTATLINARVLWSFSSSRCGRSSSLAVTIASEKVHPCWLVKDLGALLFFLFCSGSFAKFG